jgi:hypothetical protein
MFDAISVGSRQCPAMRGCVKTHYKSLRVVPAQSQVEAKRQSSVSGNGSAYSRAVAVVNARPALRDHAEVRTCVV